MQTCFILTAHLGDAAPAKKIVFSTMEAAIDGAKSILESFGGSFWPDWASVSATLASGGEIGEESGGIRLSIEAGERREPESPPEQQSDEVYLYILVRTDCPGLNPGKAVAQGSHASNAMVFEGRKKHSADLDALIDEWENQTTQGFGNCVTRSCDAADMEQTVALATLMGIHANIVHDPSYPLRDGAKVHFLPVNTCAYVFGRQSKVIGLVRKFPWMD